MGLAVASLQGLSTQVHLIRDDGPLFIHIGMLSLHFDCDQLGMAQRSLYGSPYRALDLIRKYATRALWRMQIIDTATAIPPIPTGGIVIAAHGSATVATVNPAREQVLVLLVASTYLLIDS